MEKGELKVYVSNKSQSQCIKDIVGIFGERDNTKQYCTDCEEEIIEEDCANNICNSCRLEL